ncbi:MAG: hypothetical protein ACE5LB_08195, partial [Acidiferrobacterales bacterium]
DGISIHGPMMWWLRRFGAPHERGCAGLGKLRASRYCCVPAVPEGRGVRGVWRNKRCAQAAIFFVGTQAARTLAFRHVNA